MRVSEDMSANKGYGKDAGYGKDDSYGINGSNENDKVVRKGLGRGVCKRNGDSKGMGQGESERKVGVVVRV